VPKSQFSPAYQTFIGILASARKEAGLTQAELGARIGRKQTHISIIETGLRRVDVIEFCALARAMGYDPVKLFARVCEALPQTLDV
jgi:transcriptional regulator with XRE-family HTH domain